MASADVAGELPGIKTQLENAVTRAGRALDALAKEIEKIGEGLTPEMIDLSFAHLARLAEQARQRAHFSQQVTGFSLDTPAAPVVSFPAFFNTAPAGPVRERMVGERRGKPAPLADDDGDGFIDDQ